MITATATSTTALSCTGAPGLRGTAVGGDVPAYAVGGAMAHPVAPVDGTGLPVGVALRLRPQAAEAGPRGWAPAAAVATDVQLNNDTPGDPPPRDPPS
ncbi:hypothetical protein TEK04_09975 [Klenkia sp. LSe6-5]|uniref:Uncharacterized protein n=1 Tax=Klenkia sesuvii TaxID=3103137 RepID=A0ABU8DTQ1_9ACTN